MPAPSLPNIQSGHNPGDHCEKQSGCHSPGSRFARGEGHMRRLLVPGFFTAFLAPIFSHIPAFQSLRNAGAYPDFPLREFSHHLGKTSSRPRKSDRNIPTFSEFESVGELVSTGSGENSMPETPAGVFSSSVRIHHLNMWIWTPQIYLNIWTSEMQNDTITLSILAQRGCVPSLLCPGLIPIMSRQLAGFVIRLQISA